MVINQTARHCILVDETLPCSSIEVPNIVVDVFKIRRFFKAHIYYIRVHLYMHSILFREVNALLLPIGLRWGMSNRPSLKK